MAITSKILRIADNAAMENARSVSESATPNKFDVSNLTPETTYYIEVDVVNARGSSTSAQSSFTTEEQHGLEPFNIKNISQNVATVDWNTNADNRNLQYSTDKTNWTNVPYANGKYTLTIPVGTKYYVQGNSTNFGGWWGSDEDVEIGGYILSLHYPSMEQPSNQSVNYTSLFAKGGGYGNADSKLHFNFATLRIPIKRLASAEAMFARCNSITELNYDIFYTPDTVQFGARVFARMFFGCANLTTINGFNVRYSANYGSWQEMERMFDSCTSLEYVPDDFFDTTLTPSTAYWRDTTCQWMFRGCTSLIHPPKLPAVRGGGVFKYMFIGCTSLTNANTANIMPSYTGIGTSGGEYAMNSMFYGMFYGCTGLTSMHDLSSYTMGGSGNSYFYQMYYGCTGITSIDAAKMPSGVATSNCFREMFKGCTGITSVPSGFIKPTNTAESCYREMFNGCNQITTIPSGLLPASNASSWCYAYMFYQCSALTSTPANLLPATTLGEGSYRSMFENCSSLTNLCDLPATTLGKSCYENMYCRCGNITLIPTNLFPATNMVESCYRCMFAYCYIMRGTIMLPAEELAKWCYYEMFYQCYALDGINVNFKKWGSSISTDPDYQATDRWAVGITSNTGTFTCYEELTEIYDSNHIPTNWTVVNKYASEAPTITHDDTDVIIVNNTYNDGGAIYYTTDGSTPTSASNVYTQPFLGVIGQTIKAICIYHDITSEVASWTVDADALPAPSIAGIPSNVTITNNDTTGAGAVYYTTDGTTPTSASTLYQQPFAVADGTTVKAVCLNTTGGHLISDSGVVEKAIVNYTTLAYIHNQTMEGDPPVSKNIDTGIVMDNTMKFRYKGKFDFAHGNANVNAGNMVSGNNGTYLRVYFAGGNVNLDWGNGSSAYKHGQIGYDYQGHPFMDLTCGNFYCYNNDTETMLFQDQNTADYVYSGTMTVDCSSFWLKSLQIWKTINNVETLVFDGVAAVQGGEYGLFDSVSCTLKTNSNITIVGETA